MSQRSCGEGEARCSSCCFCMAIPTLKKPTDCRCEHQGTSGCAIYATRPSECAEWLCFWLWEGTLAPPGQIPILRDDERPDRSGVFFTPNGPVDVGGIPMRWLAAYESTPGSADSWAAQKVLKRLAKHHVILMVRAVEWIGPPAAVAHMVRHSPWMDEERRKRGGAP